MAIITGDLWNDLRLALVLMVMVHIVQWAVGGTGSKKLGLVLAAIITYLTIYSHWELLIITVILFFGYEFFASVGETLEVKPHRP